MCGYHTYGDMHIIKFLRSIWECFLSIDLVWFITSLNTYKFYSFEYCTVCCLQYDYINSLAMVLGNMIFMMTIEYRCRYFTHCNHLFSSYKYWDVKKYAMYKVGFVAGISFMQTTNAWTAGQENSKLSCKEIGDAIHKAWNFSRRKQVSLQQVSHFNKCLTSTSASFQQVSHSTNVSLQQASPFNKCLTQQLSPSTSVSL